MNVIKILLASQQPLITAGLKYLIAEQEGISLCGEVTSKEALLSQLKKQQPQLLIIDIDTLPDFEVNDFSILHQMTTTTHILAISSKLEKNEVRQTMDAGVIGFLTKECSCNEIINALRTTAQGEKFYCGKVLDLLVEKDRQVMELAGPEQLTKREIQIIRCIAAGHSTKEIANTLHLSMHTINAYRKSILQKMEVRSPAELAVRAIKMGIVEI